MTVYSEQQALKDISELLPTGYVKFISFSTQRGTSFEFQGVTVAISNIRLNTFLNCYMFDLSWSSSDKIFGIPIRSGVNILEQYSTPLPNMYAYNTQSPGDEITSWRFMSLFLIDTSVLERG